MVNLRAFTSTWMLGMFMMLSCVSASAPWIGVSEGYSRNDSSTTLYSSDNYLKCTTDQQVTVRSTQDISDLIKLHASLLQPVKIRATRRGFHSSAGFVCSGIRGSSYAELLPIVKVTDLISTSITVLLHLMNRVVAVDGARHEMTVEAGMTLRDLAVAAEANGMSVPPGALSIYGNLTVGGVIMASAHGSGYRATSSLGELVRKLKWVDGRGEVIESDVETEVGAKQVRGLVGGLGLLGIVTEITLHLQPNSRTIVEVRNDLKDSNLVSELKQMLVDESPHVLAFWRPDFGKYRAVLWKQVEEAEYDPATMPEFYPNGTIAYLIPLPEQDAAQLKVLMAAWEADVKDELPSAPLLDAGVCALSQMVQITSIFQDGNGNAIDHVATIPTNNAVVSAECGLKCSFQVRHTGAFLEDTEFTIKLSQLEDWVNDVKRVVGTELAEANLRLSKRYGEGKVTRCMPPGYFWIRFGQGNQNLLSTSTGGEDVVYVQWTSTHSAMIPNKLSKLSTIMEAIEQLTLCKYKGRPHWGKNHERIIRHPVCKVRDNFPAANIAELLVMQQQHDPQKIFEPELFTNLLQKSGPDYSPLCTPHYWCYCAADVHCPAGFQCRGSASFPEYKVCSLVESIARRRR